jgi:hypothetical protein
MMKLAIAYPQVFRTRKKTMNRNLRSRDINCPIAPEKVIMGESTTATIWTGAAGAETGE